MSRIRNLTAQEVADARMVFQDSIRYENVRISDLGSGGAVTLAGRGLIDSTFIYTICWGAIVFDLGVRNARVLGTFIHELTHVWEGHHGVYPTVYMAQSVASQISHGIGDIIEKREWRGWGEHRNTTYGFSAADVGRDWRTFNVEQQVSLVESWFIEDSERRKRRPGFGPGVRGGGASSHDARFPYIRDVIRGRDRNCPYRPTALAQGASAEIKQLQDRLVALGYLDVDHADGSVGRSRSATLDAVRIFQQRNGLKPDRDLGGSNGETRRKLLLPLYRLVAAP